MGNLSAATHCSGIGTNTLISGPSLFWVHFICHSVLIPHPINFLSYVTYSISHKGKIDCCARLTTNTSDSAGRVVTEGQTDGHYQTYYLPAMALILNFGGICIRTQNVTWHNWMQSVGWKGNEMHDAGSASTLEHFHGFKARVREWPEHRNAC